MDIAGLDNEEEIAGVDNDGVDFTELG